MAKKDGVKIPKRVGGVKLPKELRKRGEALIAQAQSPEGRAAIAKGVSVVAGLVATAAAAKAAKPATAPAPTPLKAVPPVPPPGAETPPADAIAQAVNAGVEAVLGRLFAKR